MRKRFCSCFSLLVLISWQGLPAKARETDSFHLYAGLPVEAHLLIAGDKLDELVRDPEAGGETAKARKCMEAKDLVREALRKYNRFRLGSANILAGRETPPPDQAPAFPPGGESPLSLLEHLWIAADALAQTRSGIMVTSAPRSAAQAALNQVLDEAIIMIEKAIKTAESTGVWIVHWFYDQRMMISVPPEYKWSAPLKSDLLRLIKYKQDGTPMGLVYVTQMFPTAGESLATPAEFREKRIAEIRQQFPDMSVVELGENQSDRDQFTTSFVYHYAWEGDLVKSLVFIRLIGNFIFTINCVAPAASFNREEADQIIASFHKI